MAGSSVGGLPPERRERSRGFRVEGLRVSALTAAGLTGQMKRTLHGLTRHQIFSAALSQARGIPARK